MNDGSVDPPKHTFCELETQSHQLFCTCGQYTERSDKIMAEYLEYQ